MKQIITYKLSTSDLKSLEAQKDNNIDSVLECNSFEEILSLDLSKSILFLAVDEKDDKSDYISILKTISPSVVNLIFIEPNFELLMFAFKYQVNAVFEGELKSLELERAFVKMNLLDTDLKTKLPVEEILKIFSTPVKVKTDKDLYNRISGYFNSLKAVKSFSLYKNAKGEESFHGDKVPSNIINAVNKWELPRKYISLENEFATWTITPAFSHRDESLYICLELEEGSKDFVLNEHFYKYLENALIYRMNLIKSEQLELLAVTDEITGLFNQRKLAEDLEKAISTHADKHETFSLMFIDVDHFKSVNDNYGHVVGSQLLIDIGSVLYDILRQSDHIYRYGGDEFVIIMPYVDIKVVHDIATRVLAKIKAKDFILENGEIYKLSVSIGIAEYPTDANSATEILKFADEMMYMSKRSGRGKVFHVGEVENASTST